MGRREASQAVTLTEEAKPEAVLRVAKQPEAELSVVVEVPVSDEHTGGHLDNLAFHAEAALTSRQRAKEGLRRLHRGLVLSNAKTLNGKHVVHRSDAIVWILESIASAR